MILLSRLIKSQYAMPADAEKKVISIRLMENGTPSEENKPSFTHTDSERAKILMQAKQEAEWIVSKAREDADVLRSQVHRELQDWEQQKAAMGEESRAMGFERGLEEGHEKGYEEYRELIKAAQDTVEASKQDYLNHIEAAEKVILDLGMKVAGKILGKKLTENEEVFLFLVKRALKNARDYKQIQLHIHPNHYQFMLSNKDEMVAVFPKEIDLYIFPDDDLSEDSCIIESDNGRIDASVDSQLEEIKQKLFEMLESEQA